jgi:hypothetical protein
MSQDCPGGKGIRLLIIGCGMLLTNDFGYRDMMAANHLAFSQNKISNCRSMVFPEYVPRVAIDSNCHCNSLFQTRPLDEVNYHQRQRK